MAVKKSVRSPVEAVLKPTDDAGNPEGNDSEALRRLMDFYESEETANEEENEVDLIYQLYGMTNNGTKSEA